MRSLYSLLLLLLLPLPTSASAQSIVGTGDVVVDADNNLIVGETGPGSRLIDNADDGPYSNINILPNQAFPTSSLITVDNGGSLTSLGDLSIAIPDQTNTNGGWAELLVLNGSRVETDRLLIGSWGMNGGAMRIESGSAMHSSGASIRGGAFYGASISVVGPGSSWITDGGMSALSNNFTGVTISIENGAYGYAGSTGLGDGGYDETKLSVIGYGSVWETGSMGVSTHGFGVEVLDGGLINSGDVMFTSQTWTGATIQGEGSTWNIDGVLSVYGNGAGGDSFVSVGGGASLSSRATDIVGVAGGGAVAIGGGSTWWSGDLTLIAEDMRDYSNVSVSGGSLLYSNVVSFTACNSTGGWLPGGGCAITIDGPGSRWISDGPVSVAATETGLSTIDISNRALAVIRDNVTIGNNSQLNLDDGGFIAHQTTIAGGELRGTGVINGDVINSGRIAPGDTSSGDIGGIVIKGDYFQEDGATLDIQLGGTSPLDSDILVVLGTSVLDGELNITLADGYLPEHGDTFYVVAAIERLGEFDFVSGLDLGNGLTLDLSYTHHFAMLRAVDENWIAPGVPEPGAAILFAVGFAVVRRAARRKPSSTPWG